MGRARVTVLVPNPKEGFYLPAVEAMAAGTLVVCPDCVGNRAFCLDEVNCLRPAREEDAIVAPPSGRLTRRPSGASGSRRRRPRRLARTTSPASGRRSSRSSIASSCGRSPLRR